MLSRPEGVTVDEVANAWVGSGTRSRVSSRLGNPKKKLGLTLASAEEERGRVYRIAAPEQA